MPKKSGVKTTKVRNVEGYRARRAAIKGRLIIVRAKPKPKTKAPSVQPRFKPSPMGEVSIG